MKKTGEKNGVAVPLAFYNMTLRACKRSRPPASADATLVPAYDIDLAWHSHILVGTRAYLEQTRALVGRPPCPSSTVAALAPPPRTLDYVL